MKLVDVPEMEYTSKDKPFPRGEVCSRGINIFPGNFRFGPASSQKSAARKLSHAHLYLFRSTFFQREWRRKGWVGGAKLCAIFYWRWIGYYKDPEKTEEALDSDGFAFFGLRWALRFDSV